MIHANYNFIKAISCALVLTACGTGSVFDQSVETPEDVWSVEYVPSFKFEVTKPSASYNFYLNITNSKAYPYANLFVFTHMTSPSGKVQRDTLHCLLADKAGKWLGKRSGDEYINRIMFRQNVFLAESGTYSISFEQAMRHNELPAIHAVGLSVEKAQ